jgi:hypothetical protein
VSIGTVIDGLKACGCDPHQNGVGWKARCPAHDDTNPSLVINEGDDGTVLMDCKAGCDFKAIVAAARLDMKEFFAPDSSSYSLKPPVTKKPTTKKDAKVYPSFEAAQSAMARWLKAKIGGEWTYTNAAGAFVFRVVRFDKTRGDKRFYPFRHDPEGWRVLDPEGKLPLYHLPELTAAPVVFVCEGEKCADLVRGLGLVATTAAHGANSPKKTDWSSLTGKAVYFIPDYDDAGQGYVDTAAGIIKELDPKTVVKVIRLPAVIPGDDIEQWLAAGGTPEQFNDLVAAATEWVPPPAPAAPAGKGRKKAQKPAPGASVYTEVAGCLNCAGERLANFTARITTTVRRHEGASDRLLYQILATHTSSHVRETVVDCEKYSAMSWVYGLGAEFAIEAGRDTKDLVRHGIQILSHTDGIGQEEEHTSLGWIEHEGTDLYVHAGGAIGPNGSCDLVKVDVHPALARYRLADPPPDIATLREAVRAHFEIWTMGRSGRPGGRSAAAIVATLPMRAVLSACDFGVHFGGPSGNWKTSAARVAYQHFSVDVQGRNFPMPAGWNDTANALQRLCFDCRDSLLIVDDLKQEKQVQTAEIVFQAQGNLQNRMRMNRDQTLQRTLDPRGGLLSTGEVDPRTQSALGRILGIEIQSGDIDVGALSAIQEAGDRGQFALMMSGYVQYLASGPVELIRDEHRTLTATVRSQIGDIKGAHPRHSDIVAQLLAAYALFLRFAVRIKAISQVEADERLREAWTTLVELGEAQSRTQEESKLGRRFLDLLVSAMRAGRCHLLEAETSLVPGENPGACGWQKEMVYQGPAVGSVPDWRIPASSKCIGFISLKSDRVYLLPDESAAVARDASHRQGNVQTFASVGRELLNEDLCQKHVEGGKTRSGNNMRIKNHGIVRCVWVPIDKMFDGQFVESVPTVPTSGTPF